LYLHENFFILLMESQDHMTALGCASAPPPVTVVQIHNSCRGRGHFTKLTLKMLHSSH